MNPFTWIKNQPLFGDSRALILLIVNALATAGIVVYTFLLIDQVDFKVSVRYSGFNEGTLSDKGEWYGLLAFPLFAVISFIFAFILSLKVHRMRPELAQTLLGLQLVVALFTFLVARALLRILSGT